MQLTITTTHQPATDLGFLLHKHPLRVHRFSQKFGEVHVFYPEASPERCSATLVLDVDPVGLVRRRGRAPAMLEHYVNDRPYVASSFLSVAIAQVYGTALAGRSKERPELVEGPIPLEVTLSSVPCRGGEAFLRALFEPLGYEVVTERLPLDDQFPEWGESAYHRVQLRGAQRLQDLLAHLYVLVPVLDDDKHYWVGDDEIAKLLRHGERWLADHPRRDEIARRYLAKQRSLVRQALDRLIGDEEREARLAEVKDAEEAAIEKPLSLHQQRLDAVLGELQACGARRVVDLGCGEGKLLRRLLKDRSFVEILGMDVAHRALEIASERLRLEDLPPRQRERITLIQGSLTYRDSRLDGFDAAAVVEVIEHLDEDRLEAFERVLFGGARPETVVLTTPNREYNVRFEGLPDGKLRHRDHRFEWTRVEFQAWAERVADEHGYGVRLAPLGPEDDEVGAPSQMGVFSRA